MSTTNVSFDKNAFYGRNRTKNTHVGVRVERQVRTNRAKSTPTPYRSRLFGPCSSWEVFYRQKEAFDFIQDSGKKDLVVWSFESEVFVERCGQRMYLAASLPKFWHYYIQLPSDQRHHYEVIPQGAACKLYFDLEYSKEYNPGLNGCRMVDIFIQFICHQVRKVYGLACSGKDVTQLDASLPTKFSRHLIFAPWLVFRDTDAAGGFVRYCCSELERMLRPSSSSETDPASSSSPCDHRVAPLSCACPRTKELMELAQLGLSVNDLNSLFVYDKEGREVVFCDQGVYTKNRNFRLYLSCKLGKRNPFLLAPDCDLPVPRTDEEHYKVFTDTLIVVKSDGAPRNLLSWNGSGNKQADRRPAVGKPASAEGTATLSPYPEVDNFILSLVSGGGCHGNIRRWAYFSDSELLTYDIVGNRYCHNVGRPHRSNNIMILADLRQGVYYQKCHDPDCKAANYKSDEWPLPKHVLPSFILGDDDVFTSSGDKHQTDDMWSDEDFGDLDDAWFQGDPGSSVPGCAPGINAGESHNEEEVAEEEEDWLVRAAENVEKSLLKYKDCVDNSSQYYWHGRNSSDNSSSQQSGLGKNSSGNNSSQHSGHGRNICEDKSSQRSGHGRNSCGNNRSQYSGNVRKNCDNSSSHHRETVRKSCDNNSSQYSEHSRMSSDNNSSLHSGHGRNSSDNNSSQTCRQGRNSSYNDSSHHWGQGTGSISHQIPGSDFNNDVDDMDLMAVLDAIEEHGTEL